MACGCRRSCRLEEYATSPSEADLHNCRYGGMLTLHLPVAPGESADGLLQTSHYACP